MGKDMPPTGVGALLSTSRPHSRFIKFLPFKFLFWNFLLKKLRNSNTILQKHEYCYNRNYPKSCYQTSFCYCNAEKSIDVSRFFL